jgi:hypothetical protein
MDLPPDLDRSIRSEIDEKTWLFHSSDFANQLPVLYTSADGYLNSRMISVGDFLSSRFVSMWDRHDIKVSLALPLAPANAYLVRRLHDAF